MRTTIKYVFLTAIRDRLFFAIFGLGIVSFLISCFFGAGTVTEIQETRLAFAAGSLRVTLALGLIVFVCFHIRRIFESRELDVILTKPMSRLTFIMSYLSGLVFVAFLLAAFACLLIMLLGRFQQPQPALLWGFSLFLEGMIVLSFALCVSLIVKSAVLSVLGSISFYLIARMMGFFMFMVHNPTMQGGAKGLGTKFIKVVSVIVPRLDQFALSEWLVYGVDYKAALTLIVLQAFVYIPFLVSVGYFDFRRKQF